MAQRNDESGCALCLKLIDTVSDLYREIASLRATIERQKIQLIMAQQPSELSNDSSSLDSRTRRAPLPADTKRPPSSSHHEIAPSGNDPLGLYSSTSKTQQQSNLSFSLTVKFASRYLTFEVDSTFTVQLVKEKIQSMEGIHPARQSLTLFGKPLNNSHTLSECQINGDTVLELVVGSERPTRR
ncbi:hypothetical protein RCL1_001767 [Eukaryota sp. TZLM3-RCL]